MKITTGNFELCDPKQYYRIMKQPRLSCNHRTNVTDTSHSEIKANRVRVLAAVRHYSTGKIDMQIYAQILVILLTRPAALATAQRADGIHSLTPSPLSHLLSTQFLSLRFLSFSLSLSLHSFSLSFCLRCSFQQREHVLSLSACSRCSLRSRAATRG